MKKKYYIQLNHHGEIKNYYRHAPTALRALYLACSALAFELGVTPGSIYNYFICNNADNYKVEEVTNE